LFSCKYFCAFYLNLFRRYSINSTSTDIKSKADGLSGQFACRLITN
jgi:hypothetical protein